MSQKFVNSTQGTQDEDENVAVAIRPARLSYLARSHFPGTTVITSLSRYLSTQPLLLPTTGSAGAVTFTPKISHDAIARFDQQRLPSRTLENFGLMMISERQCLDKDKEISRLHKRINNIHLELDREKLYGWRTSPSLLRTVLWLCVLVHAREISLNERCMEKSSVCSKARSDIQEEREKVVRAQQGIQTRLRSVQSNAQIFFDAANRMRQELESTRRRLRRSENLVFRIQTQQLHDRNHDRAI